MAKPTYAHGPQFGGTDAPMVETLSDSASTFWCATCRRIQRCDTGPNGWRCSVCGSNPAAAPPSATGGRRFS